MLLIVGLGGFGLLFAGARQSVVLAQAYAVAFLAFNVIGFVVLLWMRTRGDIGEMLVYLHPRYGWLWYLDDETDWWLIAWLVVLAVSFVMGWVLASTHGPAMYPWASGTPSP
jgi:hypothetical protein